MSSTFGLQIKTLREKARISQNQLARRSGISQSAISSIESTTKSPSIDTALAIAKALGTTLPAILANEETPTANGDGLDEQLVNLLLSPSEVRRVEDFVAGLIAARGDGVSHQD